MVEIIPAILEDSFAHVEAQLQRIKGITRTVQLDVADGRFVPHTTWPHTTTAAKDAFKHIVSQQKGLPLWEHFDFEVDLMVVDALAEASQWIEVGASRIVLHHTSTNVVEALQALQNMRQGTSSIAIGIALTSNATTRELAQFRDMYDFVQVMGIARVGFQGEELDDRVVVLVQQLRSENPSLTIQVDGGIRMENIESIVRAGATRLVVGSSIFTKDDPKKAFEELTALANHA